MKTFKNQKKSQFPPPLYKKSNTSNNSVPSYLFTSAGEEVKEEWQRQANLLNIKKYTFRFLKETLCNLASLLLFSIISSLTFGRFITHSSLHVAIFTVGRGLSNPAWYVKSCVCTLGPHLGHACAQSTMLSVLHAHIPIAVLANFRIHLCCYSNI